MPKVDRLLDAIKPTRYQLKLEPDLASFNFTGHQVIEFEHVQAAKTLTLHSLELQVYRAELRFNDQKLAPAKTTYHKKNQTVTLHFDVTIPAGPATLELEVVGKLRDDMHGFYRSKYSVAGKNHYLATTQFEPTFAREAFICIDEPAAKAIFDITLVIPEGLTAISNTNVTRETVQRTTSNVGRKKTVKFAPTPKMSSYLAVFIIGQFEAAETTNATGTTVRVLTTPGRRHQADFALDVAAKTLDFYTEYFGIPYPLPKLDMIAIPDFMIGAMENWGAVTYRETALLIDPENSALANKQRVAMVVTHELAHQWFGNLVTMGWWTDLWLNESFASWVEYLAVDHLFPQWGMWTQFVSNDFQEARDLDSLANTHPIEVEVEDPAEINEIFDAISYQKGASVIRMLHHYLGEADFKLGIHNYLEAFKYGNAATSDLWHHLGQASGKPVDKIMSAWTGLPGFPVVEVSGIRDQGSGISLEQRRFFANPKESAKSGETWPVPIQALTEAGPSDQILFDTPTTPYTLTTTPWFKLNPGHTGFYITKYPEKAILNLERPLAEGKLEATDRLGLVSDVWSLAQAGEMGSGAALNLSRSLRGETDYAVWMSLLDGLGTLFIITSSADDLYRQLEQFDLWLVRPTAARLGWEAGSDESHFDRLLRPAMLGLSGRLGDEAVIAEARKRFEQHLKGQLISPDLRGAVYATVARHGGKAEYEQLQKLYKAATMQEEERRLMAALSVFKDQELIRRTLEFTMSEAVRSQDSLIAILHVLANRHGRMLGWQFIQEQWEELVRRYAEGMMLSHIPEQLGAVFATHEMADEIENFFAKRDVSSIKRGVQQCLERIRLQADWFTRDEANIREFFRKTELN